MNYALEARGLTKAFGNLKALDDVSLGVQEKTITILIGPNGSGKTTLINVIGGLYHQDAGSVFYAGRDITGLPAHKVYEAGLVRTFQIPSLFGKLTVLENLLVARKKNPGESFVNSLLKNRWQGAEANSVERAINILKLLGITKNWDKPASTLSGGQMKLLEIGRALMSDAQMLLLDEPISGINPTLAHEIFEKLVTLRDTLGLTFFIVEHRLDIAMKYVDTVIAMAYGKVVTSGDPQEVMKDPRLVEAYLGG